MELYYIAIIVMLLLILGFLLYLVFSRARPKVEPQQVKAGFLESLRELELDKTLGAIEDIGNEMRGTTGRLLKLLEIKRERFAYGEWQLEELLKDGLGKELFRIREQLQGIGTPDAHIKSADGIICIDCKFPLENYRGIVEAMDEEEKSRTARAFRRDILGHVESVAKYVSPENGTVPFAFLFVPSEAVYQYLAQEEPELVRLASGRGVIIVSPATLYAGLHLVRLGIRGRELTERGKEIEQKIESLRQPLVRLGKAWDITRGHILDVYRSKDDIDRWYGELSQQHQSVTLKQEEAD